MEITNLFTTIPGGIADGIRDKNISPLTKLRLRGTFYHPPPRLSGRFNLLNRRPQARGHDLLIFFFHFISSHRSSLRLLLFYYFLN